MVKQFFKGGAITLGILVALFVSRRLIVEINFGYDNLVKDESASQDIKNFSSQVDATLTIFSSLEANCAAMYGQETTPEETGAATRASDTLDAYFKYARAFGDFHQVEKEYQPRWFLRLIPSFRRRYESVQSALDADLPEFKRKLAESRGIRAHYDGACRTGNLHYGSTGAPWLM